MIESASGIILRTRPLTETSLIIHWLTPELGRLATVAKGARRPKSPYAGKLDLFYSADFSFSRSRTSDLHNLREVSLRETRRPLRENLSALQPAAYAANFIEQVTESETPLPEIYALARQFLDLLCTHPPQPKNVLAFELKLLQEMGLAPDLESTRLTPGSRKMAQVLLAYEYPMIQRIELSAAQHTELRQWLHGFLIFNLGRLPKGREMALAGH